MIHDSEIVKGAINAGEKRLPARNCIECQWCAGGCGIAFAEFLCSRPGELPVLLPLASMVRRCPAFIFRGIVRA